MPKWTDDAKNFMGFLVDEYKNKLKNDRVEWEEYGKRLKNNPLGAPDPYVMERGIAAGQVVGGVNSAAEVSRKAARELSRKLYSNSVDELYKAYASGGKKALNKDLLDKAIKSSFLRKPSGKVLKRELTELESKELGKNLLQGMIDKYLK